MIRVDSDRSRIGTGNVRLIAEIYPAGDSVFAAKYLSNGYNVIQTQWQTDWEAATTNPTYLRDGNILEAACRPAGFLSFARNDTTITPRLFPTGGGMCAHGFSAGSAAIAYPLAWYGAGNLAQPGAGAGLDKAAMLVGPPLSDVAQGCVVPHQNQIKICEAGQSYCQGWQSGVSQWPSYVQGTQSWVQGWTDDPSCFAGTGTSTTSYNNWLAQSIVNGPNGGGGTFNYPSTTISAWLCDGNLAKGLYNESSPQGFLYYAQVGGTQQQLPFNVMAADQCNGPEGITDSGATINSTSNLYAGFVATAAIETDMSDLANSQTVACKKNLGH